MGAPSDTSGDPSQRPATPPGARGSYRAAPQSPNEALQPEVPPPPPPVPPSRRRPVMSAVSGFLSFLVIAALAGVLAVMWGEQRINAPGPLAADKVVFIVPGTELGEIIDELDREGVIDSPFLFNAALTVGQNRSKVKAGEYLFKQGASLRKVIDTLVSGKQVLHAVTIPEGLTSQQIVERLLENDVLSGEVRDLPKEGSLMPDTYKVTRGWARGDLLKKMQDDQKRAVDQVWAKRSPNLPLHSPYELVILASIVEKETGKADERPRVASVFMNRLAKRMRLQSDPTIVYGLVGGKGTLGRGITRSELERQTPFNTYTIDGLPPGPIANPGRAALEAVANPSRTQDLYFVADGSGGHVFAETLDQHSRNVQRWRQIEKDRAGAAQDLDRAPQSSPAPPPAGGRTAPPRPDQRGARQGGVYGALPAFSTSAPVEIAGSEFERAYGALGPALSIDAPWSSAIKTGEGARSRSGRAEKFAAARAPLTLGPGLSELGLTVAGAAADAALDGPSDEGEAAAAASAQGASAVKEASWAKAPGFPERRGEDRNAAASVGPDVVGREADRADPELALRQTAALSAPTPPAEPQRDIVADAKAPRPRIYDVSEGTALDPLRDSTYDLNFAKTVPSAKQMALPN